VQIGKKAIEDVFLDGGWGVNIVTKQLRTKLRSFKLVPYNLWMENHIITKLGRMIRDLKMYAHGIT
jgi:hypothetical protein